MSLGSILSVARSALSHQQLVIQTAGHNIANAETEGFTRQRVDGQAAYPQRFPYGSVGTGVAVDDIRRQRDVLLDVSYRSEASGYGAASLRQELLSGVEGILGEPSDDGLAAAMDAFWSGWSELANAPTSAAARSVVQQRARNVTSLFNTYDARLTATRDQTRLRLENSLVELNALTDEIARLNGRIVSAEVGGQMANDLRDQRDLAVDKLSKLGDLRALPQPDGAVTIVLGNTTVVDGIHATPLRIAATEGATLQLATAARPYQPLQAIGGSTQAMVDFLNVELSDVQEKLDALANGFARAVNAIHQRGNDGTPAAPYDAFFVDKTTDGFAPGGDPHDRPLPANTVTARTIGLFSAIDADASRIATTSSRTARPADNDIALALAGLRTASRVTVGGVDLGPIAYTLVDRSTNPPGRVTQSGTSLADFYRATTSALATNVKDAESAATVRRTLTEQADQRRQAISGVNIDEELTTLMRAQQAYAAAAKVITVADEMMQSLVNMI